MASKFSWQKVDPKLARAMLVAAYTEQKRPEEAKRAATLADDRVSANAQKVLGRPPKPQRFTRSVAKVVREQWIPRLPAAEVRHIASQVQLSKPGAGWEIHNKADALAYLNGNNLTTAFIEQLRRAFNAAHREQSDPRATPAGRVPTQKGEWLLVGEGATGPFEPHRYQEQAWQNLDGLLSEEQRPGGLVVLPTGAGKTFTAVAWLVQRLTADPSTRVLWLADQQELVEQAARTFDTQARQQPMGFERRMRVIHSAGSAVSALGQESVDVVCITRQSLIRRGVGADTRARLERFLSRPTIVVVDEAHHAVSPTYRQLLETIRELAPPTPFLGLTATPWPSGYGRTGELRRLFPTPVVEVTAAELVQQQILATPHHHTVETHQLVQLTQREAKAGFGDLPEAVLARLDQVDRNELIVRTWLGRRELWGKTLLFAVNIDHANELAERFREADVAAVAVHTEAAVPRATALADFRAPDGTEVLISVGMLNEGVDLPQATTAFLARPTSSRILMKQMIGRVMRGPVAGGGPVAHIVNLVDRWSDDIDVLSPIDLPAPGGSVLTVAETDGTEHRLPPLLDDNDDPVSVDVLRQIERSYRDSTTGLPHAMTLSSTELIGHYDLDEIRVPVFDHVRSAWEDLFAMALGGDVDGATRPEHLFEDLPAPRPTSGQIKRVRDLTRDRGAAPLLVAHAVAFSLPAVVREFAAGEPLSERAKIDRLKEIYESGLARMHFPDFPAFHEAVSREILARHEDNRSLTAGERGPAPVEGRDPVTRPRLTPAPDRDVAALFKATVAGGRELLIDEPEDYRWRLTTSQLPKVSWTRRPVQSTFAHWVRRMSGQSVGQPAIRVNRALQADPAEVSDDLLRFLIWHELCHHVIPLSGHNREFRRLEVKWPDFARLDHELDALGERYDWSVTRGDG